jgi:pullulanase/glycogen debranching enzyme
VTPDGVCDIVWYDQNLRHPVWSNARKHTLCCQLAEEEGGGCPSSCLLYFIFNAANRQVKVKLPRLAEGHAWRRIVDTSLLAGDDFREQGNEAPLEGEGTTYVAAAQSVVVLTNRYFPL